MDDLTRNLLIGRYWRLSEIINRLNDTVGHVFANVGFDNDQLSKDANDAWTIIDACRQSLISERTLIHGRLGFMVLIQPSFYQPFWNEINWGHNPERW